MKKVFKKGSNQLILQIVAVAIICGVIFLMYKSDEGFQGSANNYAAVGIHFNGALSEIYKTFTNTDPAKGPILEIENNTMFPPMYPSYIKNLMTNPALVLSSFLSTYPDFKYSIIQVSTGNIIYDPINEYASKRTMSPFPNTTNIDDYIIYSNLLNMPISAAKATASGFYTSQKTGQQLSNCSSQSARTTTEQIIKDIKASVYPNNYAAVLSATANTAANKLVENLLVMLMEPDINIAFYITAPTPSPFSATLISGIKNAAFTAVSSTGYTDATLVSSITPAQATLANSAVLRYLSSSTDTVAINAMIIYNAYVPLIRAGANVNNIADQMAGHIGFINNITYKSTVYEPCVPFTQGFTNYEGFTTSINLDKLYDSNGNKIIRTAPPAPPAPPATPPAKPADKPAEKSSSNTALYVVAGVATVAVVGGAALMMVKPP